MNTHCDCSVRYRHVNVDVNDNSPVFGANSYSGFVIEGTGMGHIVTVVSATDADAGVNGVIDFRLQVFNKQANKQTS